MTFLELDDLSNTKKDKKWSQRGTGHSQLYWFLIRDRREEVRKGFSFFITTHENLRVLYKVDSEIKMSTSLFDTDFSILWVGFSVLSSSRPGSWLLESPPSSLTFQLMSPWRTRNSGKGKVYRVWHVLFGLRRIWY